MISRKDYVFCFLVFAFWKLFHNFPWALFKLTYHLFFAHPLPPFDGVYFWHCYRLLIYFVVFHHGTKFGIDKGSVKKSETWAVHLLIRWLFLLFYSNNMHKWLMKNWFLTCQMPVLSGRINFDPFLKTWKFFSPKFPMKYSKNGQNFTTPKNT